MDWLLYKVEEVCIKKYSLCVILLAAITAHGQPPDTLWTRTYGGPETDLGDAGTQTADGGYIITGSTYSYSVGEDDIWLIKTDASGKTLWTKTFGGINSEYGTSVAQTTDSGYIITGWTYSYGAGLMDVWLIKTDASGDTLWTKIYGGTDSDCGSSVAQTTDGGYIIGGETHSYGAGSVDAWLIKTKPEVGIMEDDIVARKNDLGATIICGPLLLREGQNYKVYDVIGRTVSPKTMKPGIYFIEIEGQFVNKVVKVK